MKKLNVPSRVAIFSLILAIALSVGEFVFALMPLYALPGKVSSLAPGELEKELHRLSVLTHVINYVIAASLAVMIISLILGINKSRARNEK